MSLDKKIHMTVEVEDKTSDDYSPPYSYPLCLVLPAMFLALDTVCHLTCGSHHQDKGAPQSPGSVEKQKAKRTSPSITNLGRTKQQKEKD